MGRDEIEAMALLVLAGMSHRALLYARDPVERDIDQAVATRALALRTEQESVRDQNLANRITSGVGKHVGDALSQALQSISRAMRG